MVANTNITAGSSAVVIDQRMWAGSDPSSTTWLQSPIGSNNAEGALNLLVVDHKARCNICLRLFIRLW